MRHVVITSVNRDELKDGWASIFAETIRHIRKKTPSCTVEVLIPDFQGHESALALVMDKQPDILNHNIETVPELYKHIRPGARYQHSLALLKRYKALRPDVSTKSGIMVGLGETFEQVINTIKDLRAHDVNMITIGQYLQPSKHHAPVERFVHPDEFREYARVANELGFTSVASGPMVRSSYHADLQHKGVDVGLHKP